MTATPGQSYEGVVYIRSADLNVVVNTEAVIVAQSKDLVQQHGMTAFTASEYGNKQDIAQVQVTAVPEIQAVPAPELKTLSKEDFAMEAAKRLTEALQQGKSVKAARELAEHLGAEAERKIDLSVITEQRFRMDAKAAYNGQPAGFQQMFREVSDSQQVSLLKSAIRTLGRQGENPAEKYLTVARAGQQYAGQVESKNVKVALVAQGNVLLATPAASLKNAEIQADGTSKFTAQEAKSINMKMDY